MIQVEQTQENDPFEFQVSVSEGKTQTQHHVTLSHSLYKKLTDGKVEPDRLIEAAFQFLLDREPKEAILSRFDVSVISKYFPEFEKELVPYLSG